LELSKFGAKFKRVDESSQQNKSDIEENFGFKLFALKDRMMNFFYLINDSERFISQKCNLLKYEVEMAYEHQTHFIKQFKQFYFVLIDKYENQFKKRMDKMHEITKFIDENKAYIQKLVEKQRDLSESDLRFHELETLCRNYNQYLTLNLVIIHFYLSSNKLLNIKLIGLNRIKFGSIDYNDSGLNELSSQKRKLQFDDKHDTNFSNNICYKIKSVYTINSKYHQSNENCFIVFYECFKERDTFIYYKLKLFDKHGTMKRELTIRDKHVFTMNTDSNYLIVCYKVIHSEQIEMAMFDNEFNLIHNRPIDLLVFSTIHSVPLDLFINDSQIFLLSSNMSTNCWQIAAFDYSFVLLNVYEIKNIQSDLDDLNYTKLFVTSENIFLKQKVLFGTKIDVLKLNSGEIEKELLIYYYFDLFYVEKSMNSNYFKVIFMSNGKIHTFDTLNNSILFTNQLDMEESYSLKHLCYDKSFNIVGLLSN